MNYIAEINGFERWLETHSLPTLAQLLWYKLLYWSSRSGWPEWTQVDNRRLMVSLQIAREASLTESRERLVNAGLIEYQKGRKGIPGRYRMISFSEKTSKYTYNTKVQNEAQSVVYPVCNPVVYSEVQNVGIIKNKQKQKQKQRDAFSDEISTIRELYNSVCGSYPRLKKMSEARKKAIQESLGLGYTIEEFRLVFEMAENSDFLKGQNPRGWSANFDWLIKADNMAKVLEGNYANRTPEKEASQHADRNRFRNFDSRSGSLDDFSWVKNRNKSAGKGEDECGNQKKNL